MMSNCAVPPTACVQQSLCTRIEKEHEYQPGGFTTLTPGNRSLAQVPSVEPACLLGLGSPVTLTDKVVLPTAAASLR